MLFTPSFFRDGITVGADGDLADLWLLQVPVQIELFVIYSCPAWRRQTRYELRPLDPSKSPVFFLYFRFLLWYALLVLYCRHFICHADFGLMNSSWVFFYDCCRLNRSESSLCLPFCCCHCVYFLTLSALFREEITCYKAGFWRHLGRNRISQTSQTCARSIWHLSRWENLIRLLLVGDKDLG